MNYKDKLEKIALKPFDFQNEIEWLFNNSRYIPAFLLSVCKLESMCFRCLEKMKLKLDKKFISSKNTDLKDLSLGNLIKYINENNKKHKLNMDSELFDDLGEINKLRNEIIHHLLKDYNLDLDDYTIKSKEKFKTTRVCTQKLWREYCNNEHFSKLMSEIK